jgi:hypothetical protein
MVDFPTLCYNLGHLQKDGIGATVASVEVCFTSSQRDGDEAHRQARDPSCYTDRHNDLNRRAGGPVAAGNVCP